LGTTTKDAGGGRTNARRIGRVGLPGLGAALLCAAAACDGRTPVGRTQSRTDGASEIEGAGGAPVGLPAASGTGGTPVGPPAAAGTGGTPHVPAMSGAGGTPVASGTGGTPGCSGSPTPFSCVYPPRIDSQGGGRICEDVWYPTVCIEGSWGCAAPYVPVNQCDCSTGPSRGCVCTPQGWLPCDGAGDAGP
jgi:hypothetical protein